MRTMFHWFLLEVYECDLEEERTVSITEGKDLAHQSDCPFMEVSARENTNISKAFMQLARLVHAKYGKIISL